MRGKSLIALVLGGCVPHLGHPQVHFGDATTLPLVHPSNDVDRWYVAFDGGDLGPQLWFVDTGYSYSTCDDDTISGLDVPTRGKVRIRGEAGDLYAPRARLPWLAIGDHEVRLTCVVRDLNATSSIADPPEVKVNGVLGSDVMRRFDLVFDPSTATMLLLPRDGLPRFHRSEAGVVPIRREYGIGLRFRVPVGIADEESWPVVDTGATGTYVDGTRLGLVASLSQKGVSVRASGSTGVVIRDVVYYHVDGVDLAGDRVGPLLLTDRDRGPWAAGLLGLNVLSQVRAEYDFRRGRARFTPVRPIPVPAWQGPAEPPSPAAEPAAEPSPP